VKPLRLCFDEKKVRKWAMWFDRERIRSREKLRKQWPHRGEPWSQGEDRRLLRLMRQYERQPDLGRNPFGPGRAKAYMLAAHDLGRTPSAIVTRLAILSIVARGL
jgi:hypothetical protein